jgi:hypothetical protein
MHSTGSAVVGRTVTAVFVSFTSRKPPRAAEPPQHERCDHHLVGDHEDGRPGPCRSAIAVRAATERAGIRGGSRRRGPARPSGRRATQRRTRACGTSTSSACLPSSSPDRARRVPVSSSTTSDRPRARMSACARARRSGLVAIDRAGTPARCAGEDARPARCRPLSSGTSARPRNRRSMFHAVWPCGRAYTGNGLVDDGLPRERAASVGSVIPVRGAPPACAEELVRREEARHREVLERLPVGRRNLTVGRPRPGTSRARLDLRIGSVRSRRP